MSKPRTLSEIPSNNLARENPAIHETRPHNALPNIAAPLSNNTNGAAFGGRIVKNNTRRDLVLPLLSGLLIGVFEHFYDGESYYRSMKIGFEQAISYLAAEFVIGFLPAMSEFGSLIEEYSVDIISSALFGVMEMYFHKEKGLKKFTMSAFYSFFAVQLAKYIEAPLNPYIPKMIRDFKV